MSHTASVDFAVESALAAKAAAAEVAAVEVPAVAPSTNQQGALPDKFKNADAWNYRTQKRVNPMYATTSSQIGCRPPASVELPKQYFPMTAEFSKSFNGIRPQNNGLNVSMNVKKMAPTQGH